MSGGDGSVHHHGVFAGASAGAVGVAAVALLAALLVRHVLAEVLTVLLWFVVAAAVLGLVFGVRWVWHRHRQYAAAAQAAAAPVIRAEVVNETPAGELAGALRAVTAGMDPEAIAVLLHKLHALHSEPLELERGE
jgi:hypothetical protein